MNLSNLAWNAARLANSRSDSAVLALGWVASSIDSKPTDFYSYGSLWTDSSCVRKMRTDSTSDIENRCLQRLLRGRHVRLRTLHVVDDGWVR